MCIVPKKLNMVTIYALGFSIFTFSTYKKKTLIIKWKTTNSIPINLRVLHVRIYILQYNFFYCKLLEWDFDLVLFKSIYLIFVIALWRFMLKTWKPLLINLFSLNGKFSKVIEILYGFSVQEKNG